jgi:PhnB protein
VEEFRSTITPVLTVRDAAQAIVFYGRAFGAEENYRNTCPDGRIVAEMAVEGARFRVADEAPEASNLSPQTLNGTTVRINLLVADPDKLAARADGEGTEFLGDGEVTSLWPAIGRASFCSCRTAATSGSPAPMTES